MAEKTLNTRFQLRYDTLANWNTYNPLLKKGEIAIVEVPANGGEMQQEPAFLIKVGTGATGTKTVGGVEMEASRFKALEYITAKAGNVYSWALAATKPTYNAAEVSADSSSIENYSFTTVQGALEAIITNLNAIDTDTQYQLEAGTGENAGKIRLNYKAKDANSWTSGSWVAVGVTVAAKDDSIAVDTTTTAGQAQVSVKISDTAANALTLNTTSGHEGLYVHETTISNPGSANETTATDTVDVVTAIAQDSTNKYQLNLTKETVYTKAKIDALINPGMEFKGVKSAAEIDAMTLTEAMLGNSYKIDQAGTINGITVKAGDLAIVGEQTADGEPTGAYEWNIIPAGDDVEDTWRAIKVDGTQKLGNGISTGALDLVSGTGINLSESNGAVTFTADVNTIATTTMTSGNGNGKTLQGQIDTLNADNTTTGSVAKAIKDTVDGLDATLTAGQDSNNKQKVYTVIAEVDGKLDTTNSTATVLGIEDIDIGDYLLLNGGAAATYDPISSGT